MTREQHEALKGLYAAQWRWLLANGWQPLGLDKWRHQRLTGSTRYSTHDALEQLRATPWLGWP